MDVHPPKYGIIGFDPWPYPASNDIVISNLSAGPALFGRSRGPDGSTVPRAGGVDTAGFPALRCFLSLSLAV